MSCWDAIETDSEGIRRSSVDTLVQLANGSVAAIVVRGAFPPNECANLMQLLVERGLMFASDDDRIEAAALAPDRVDQWTRNGLNPADSARRRIDIGASLGNYGGDKDDFLRRSADAHRLFDELFGDRPNPIETIYDCLQQLAPSKRVVTAAEPDGRRYGPAIFRIHYGGYTYGPHFDSVRLRESRSDYAVHRFSSQFAGVLCVQNATADGRSAQGIIHRVFWSEQVEPSLKSGRFPEYARDHAIENVRVELEPGDLYFFNTGLIHEVPGVDGDLPRVVLATFIGWSADDPDVMVWS